MKVNYSICLAMMPSFPGSPFDILRAVSSLSDSPAFQSEELHRVLNVARCASLEKEGFPSLAHFGHRVRSPWQGWARFGCSSKVSAPNLLRERRITGVVERELEQREEKEGRRRKNFRERTLMDAYLKDRWEIITRGIPTFLARKPGHPFRAVWVERQNVNPEEAGLTKAQTFVRSIFMTKEIDCRVEGAGPNPSRTFRKE